MRGDRVEQLGGGGDAETDHVQQELAGEVESFPDVVAAVEPRVHDQAFPADGGAGFLEINPHDQQHFAFHLVRELGESPGVFAAGGDVVDGAGAGDDEQAGIVPEDDLADRAAALEDEVGIALAGRELFEQVERGG